MAGGTHRSSCRARLEPRRCRTATIARRGQGHGETSSRCPTAMCWRPTDGFSRLGPDGTQRWAQQAQIADFRGQAERMTVSADGARVGFGYELVGASPAQFDVATRTLPWAPHRRRDGHPKPDRPEHRELVNNYSPTLDGKALNLKPFEVSRSLAIHPSGKSFVLGTSWYLRAYDAQGNVLWSRPVPGEVWAVNITGDGRLVVAAYGDGTIRWHRMTDGAELLAFMPLADRTNWVAWTPEGFYAATAGAQGVLRWHVNQGWEPADSVPSRTSPALTARIAPARPAGARDAARARPRRPGRAQSRGHASHPQPHFAGAQLHLLTIGIDQYNEEYAKNLRLQFADRDAHDLASAIVNTQSALYRSSRPCCSTGMRTRLAFCER